MEFYKEDLACTPVLIFLMFPLLLYISFLLLILMGFSHGLFVWGLLLLVLLLFFLFLVIPSQKFLEF